MTDAVRPVSFRTPVEPAPRLSQPYVKGRWSSRHWTQAEDAIVREHYPKGGAALCQVHLPTRNIGTIYQRAAKLGLRREGRSEKRQHEVDDGFDDRLRERWALLAGRGAVQALADELGLPRWWLSKRALKLGLTLPHKKEPPWTAAEEALLRNVPLHDPGRCVKIFRAHGFLRSPTAIIIRANRRALSPRATHEGFSGSEAARILGVDNKSFSTWCIAGEVRATRRGTRRLPQQGGDVWEVQPTELRRFILANLERIDLRKVEKFAFVQVLVAADDTPAPDLRAARPSPAGRQEDSP